MAKQQLEHADKMVSAEDYAIMMRRLSMAGFQACTHEQIWGVDLFLTNTLMQPERRRLTGRSRIISRALGTMDSSAARALLAAPSVAA